MTGLDAEDEEDDTSDGWEGFPDRPDLEILDHEEEYVDEDRYTTVTVESVSVSRDGLSKPEVYDEDAEEAKKRDAQDAENNGKEKAQSRPKQKKKKFRYESKFERQGINRQQRAKHRAKRPA